MTLHVRAQSIGKKLNRLLIFNGGQFIGEYERSQAADIPRKTAEIANAESLLVAVFHKHGQFVVRWEGVARKKSIRVAGTEVSEVPKAAWTKPSWE